MLALGGVAINLVWAQMAMGRPDVASDLVARAHARLPEGDVPDFLRFVGGWAQPWPETRAPPWPSSTA